MAKYNADEQFIGTLKSTTADNIVKRVLDVYNVSNTFQDNVNSLGKDATILKDHLTSTLNFLFDLKDDYPDLVAKLQKKRANTKALLANLIVTFIHFAGESNCLKCSTLYAPYRKDNANSELTCYKCDRPCHTGCYSDSLIDSENGIVYICSLCLPTIKSTNVVPSLNSAPKEPLVNIPDTESPDKTDDLASDWGDEPEEDDNWTDAKTILPKPPSSGNPTDKSGTSQNKSTIKSKVLYDRTKTVCKLLIEGTCPHGFSGQKDGVCTEYHPPWCHRFTKNGPGGQRGCKYGADKCNYFHPNLCQNGLQMKCCFNKDCKLVHIRGCNRSKQPNNNPQNPPSGSKSKSSGPKASIPPKSAAPSTSGNRKTYASVAAQSNPSAQSKRTRNDTLSSQSSKFHSKNEVNSKVRPNYNNEDFQRHLESLKSDLAKMVSDMVTTSMQALCTNPQFLQSQMSMFQKPTQNLQSVNFLMKP